MNRFTQRVTIITSIVVGFVGFAMAESDRPTKGPVPDNAFENGRVNIDAVPDYFPVYARDGIEIAGYIRKEDYFVDNGPRAARIKVVDETLSRAVGDMVLGRGFVPLGTPDEAIPSFPSR